MSIVEYLSQPLWQRLGLTLVHFLWQGLAVAVLAGAFVRVFRLKHGNARYVAYLLAFIAMIACPVVTFTAIDIPISPDTEIMRGAESAEVIESSPYTALPEGAILPEAETSGPAVPTLEDSIPLGQKISDWLNISMPFILVIWMAGVVVLSVRLLMGFVGVYRWRHHLEALPERLALRIASLSEVLGMRGFSRIFISPTVLQAMAVGYLRPMVLLPAAMVTQMQPEMLEAVIAHELAHIRRFDLWVNLIQRVTETLLFYHPAVWWLSICLRSERELCCDELAVKATGERITYATTLESVGRARFMAKPPVLAAGLGRDNKPTLGRVRHILGLAPSQRSCPFWLAGVITVLFLAALVIPTGFALTARSEDKSDAPGKSEHIDVETLLNKVRQAQRPTANMIVEWRYESPQPVFVIPARSREPDFSPPSRILKTYKAIIAGDKSRIEERELTLQSQKDTEPSRIREITYVFDGTMQKQLDHFVKGFENEYRGYRHTYDKNTQLLLKLLLAYPPFLDNPELSEKYNIKVTESKEKGLIILETSKENSGIHRFTIDPDKDYNIVKQEVILPRGKDYEINCIVKKQANGLWYQVAREQIRYSVKTGKPFLENKVKITKLDFNPEIPTGAFELQFPKGIKIWDGSLKDWIIVGDEEETSREPDVEVEVETPDEKIPLVWGEAVEGVQMRVRPERQRWYEGETPKFRVDMRNKGTFEWKLGLTQSNWEVELDGLWHRVGVLSTGYPRTLLLGPGQEHKDIEFYPGVWSEWHINGKPMKFTPGSHTVRLSFVPSTRDSANLRRLHVVSNAVVIEVLPAEADKRYWGEAVAGLQCGLRADKRLWKADETPKLQAVARNVGRDPWRLPEFFFLKVAGKIWRWKGPGPGEPVELKPGEDLDKTTILLSSEDWVPPYESDLRLELSPGKHIVQLVIIVSVPVPPEDFPVVALPVSKQLRIESNVVVVEVLPTGSDVKQKTDVPVKIQEKKDQKEFSKFKTTLPNGVTVELVGICEYPSAGKQWWRPDGTPFTLPAGIKVEDRISTARWGDNAYQFLFRYNSQEDLMWNSLDAVCLHFSIEGDSGVSLINLRRPPKDGQDGLFAKVAIFKEPLDSTTIQANLATGNWQTQAVRDISKIDQRNEDLYWFTSETPSIGLVSLNILHRIEGQQIKTIAIDREGNEYDAGYSLGSFGGRVSISQIEGRRYHARVRKDARLVKFKLQSRPFWSSVIGNVSLKPNFKTDTQVEGEVAIDEIDAETLINKVRQSIQPSETMQISWSTETMSLPPTKSTWVVASNENMEDKYVLWRNDYNYIISGVRSRFEYITEVYQNRDDKVPFYSRRLTSVFDSKELHEITEEIKKGNPTYVGRRSYLDDNQRYLFQRVAGFPPDLNRFNQGRIFNEFEFNVFDSGNPGIYVLDAVRKEDGMHWQLSIDGNRNFNNVKTVLFKSDDTGGISRENNVILKRYDNGFWYPMQVKRIQYHNDTGEVQQKSTVDINVQFDIRVQDDIFKLDFPQGMRVFDVFKGKWVTIEGNDISEQTPAAQVEGTGITAEKESEFSAILPNGVTVELIGMCEYPNVDKQWWQPDGSLLVNPPYDESNIDILSSRKPNAIPIEFAFRLSGNLGEPAWEAQVKGDEQAFVWWTGRRAKDGELRTDIKSIGMFVKSDQRILDLRLGFSFADRPYEWVDFKNISVKPNFKPDVQVEAGKEALTAEKLVLKLVDNSGRPVAGAKVGTSVRTRDKQILNSKLYWSLSGKEKDVSDEEGKIVLTRDKLFPQSWNPDRRRALYILNEERQIGAFCEISKDDERNQIELTLEPVCHVHGKLSSEDLEKIGRPLTWSNVYLGFNKDSQSVLSCMSEKQQFDFWVPPGEYKLSAYGSGEGASTKHVRPIIEVNTGQSELDLGVVDLPATKLSTLIGKPAPEIGPIKAWKNGSPITLAELRGKAVIIYFDGTSPNTSRDLPRLVDLHNQFEANGLVIVALYNCPSMEALEAKWVEVYKKYGGVQNVPFRVAVDGGKSTFYEGSVKERPGATYAIYDITSDPTTILIDPDGKIVGKLGLYGAKEKLKNMLGVEVKTMVSAWRQRFEEVYRLEDNRILKRIAPPFIPERRDYYVNEHSSQASAISRSPDRFIFHWNGKLKNWGLGFTNKLDLDSTLRRVLRLKSFEYDGPEELLSIELPGDWIIRDEVSQKIKLKALEQLIAEELSRTIQFEKPTIERQVIVVTGSFKFHPPSETYEHTSVHLYADELDPDEGSGGGTADSVNDFILRLGSLVDMPVSDHTESSKKILVPYRHHRSSYLRRIKDKAEKAGKLQVLLANLTKQTELQFRIQKRPVEVWFVTEKKKDK